MSASLPLNPDGASAHKASKKKMGFKKFSQRKR